MFFKKGKPLTSLDLCFIANIPTRYQRNLNRAVLRTFKLVPTVVVESHRANVSWTHCLNPYLEHAREVLKDVDPMLFFNLDEVGVQAWADAGSTHVLVPAGFTDSQFYYPVKRACARFSILACVNMLGLSLRSLVIVPTKTLQSHFWQNGYGASCLPVHANKAYINSNAFVFWIKKVFAPMLASLRAQCERKKAVVLMDGCTSHFTEAAKKAFAEIGVTILKLPPHTSHITQPLDLTVFSPMKTILRSKDTSGDKTTVALEKAINALNEAATFNNVKKGFARAGFELEVGSHVDDDKADVEDIDEVDTPFAEVSEPVTSIKVVKRRVREQYEKYAQLCAERRAPKDLDPRSQSLTTTVAKFMQQCVAIALNDAESSRPGQKRHHIQPTGPSKQEQEAMAFQKIQEALAKR